MLNTYRVPQQNLDQLQARIAKLAKRCTRIGVAAPVLTVGDFTERTIMERGGIELAVPIILRTYAVTLDAPERPKIDGYEFIGTISPVIDDTGKVIGNILRMVPGNEAPAEYRDAKNYCDHCKTERRRSETFLIKSDAGVRQIGRNCVAGYLGLANPHTMAMLAELLIHAGDICGMAEDEDGFGVGGSRAHERYPLDDILTVAASAIRLYGWLSNKSGREFMKASTSHRVSEWIFGGPKVREQFEFPLVAIPEDEQLAADTIAWLQTLGEPAEDYMYNLSLLARAASITPKNFGIAISAINAFSREKEREIRRNARLADDKLSEYIGQPKERLDFEALVVYTNTWENDFGITHFYKMKQGNDVVIYFASKEMGWEMGQTVKFKASVKQHELRDGIKQTQVTRAKEKGYEPTKEEKKAIKKLNHISAAMYQNYDYEGRSVIDTLLQNFKDGKFATPTQEVAQ
jgi:hypothetical protein